jgi:HlyD family secretion protein
MKRLPFDLTPSTRGRRVRALAGLGLLLVSTASLQGCLNAQDTSQLPGYIEADLTSVASPVAGILANLGIKEGQSVKQGDKLYLLESNREQAQLAEAEARKAQADSQSRNVSKGARTAELDTYRAKLRYTKAQLAQAQTQLKKTEALLKKGFIAEAQVEADRTNVQLAQAQVEEARAALRVAHEGGRKDEQDAVAAQADAAKAGVSQVQWLLQQKQVTAPIDGVVQEVFIRQGEFAQSGATVLTLLQKNSLRVRFFVPNDLRPRFMPGSAFDVKISGCDKIVKAHTTRVSARPEYTNPLMFGPELRDRLSFLTEGHLDEGAGCSVPPGTPVGVVVPEAHS